MDTIEVKMRSPTKKRAGDDDPYERREKRQATTPPRLTRAMLRKLNEKGGPPVELNPGLDMGIRRRSQGTRPPKRAAQDEAVGGSAKRTSKTRKKGRGAKSQPRKSQLVESRPTEPRVTEPQSTEPIPIEPQPTEPQPTESQPTEQQFIQVPPIDQEKKISEADVAAASRLAQAAMAAGLTGTSSEAGSPVVEGLTDLVRFTTEDLRTILSETVMEDEIRLKIEPHWLARMEFLTWLERPSADMHRIKGEISRLAARWSRDLRNQDTIGVDIPISTLESWRADITIVSDPGRSADSSEGRNEGENTSDEKMGAEKDEGDQEGGKKESDTDVDETQAAEEARDEAEGDEEVSNHDRSEVLRALAESVTLMARDMAEWKEAFGKEMTAEPDFRSKRAWDARISESQREAEILEKKAENLDVCKSLRITKSATQAAEQMLDELQKFRIGLRMDREAFWDEFDQEGAEMLLEKTEIHPSVEEEVQGAVEDVREAVEDAREALEDVREAFEDVQEAVQEDEAGDIVSVKIEVRMTDFEAEAEEALMTESEELRGPSTGSDGVEGVKSDPTEEPLGEENDDNDSNPTTVLPEQPSVEETTVCGFLPVNDEESTPPFQSHTADLKSESDVSKAQERSSRSPVETYAGRGITSPRNGEESVAQSVAEIEHQDREPQAAEAGEKLDSRESTPWLPDKRGSHSPSWKWPKGEGHRGEEAKVNDHEIAAAVEEDDGSPREGGRETSSGLFSSRSASAEQASSEEENRADHAMNASDGSGVPQERSSISSSTQPQGADGGDVKIEDTADRSFTASHTVHLQEQDKSSLASSSRAVSPDIIICEARNAAKSPSNASNISSLPEDTSSSPGRSEAGEEDIEGASITEWAPAVPSVLQDTSLSQEIGPPSEGVRMESSEGNRAGTEDTVDSNSSTSNIARLLEEVSLPKDTSSSTTGAPSGSVEEIGGEPREETAVQTSSTNPPQAASPIASGIRSGSDTGVGSEAEDTVEDHAATPSDAASLAQGSSVAEDPGAPLAISVGESPVVVPNVRYIKPQWESLFSPEEPTYTANDYSANEVDDENQDDEFDEVDDREADDVDP